MSMPSWPSALPLAPLLEGFVEKTPETVIRTEMDQGPAKMRQRSSAGIRRFQMSFLLNKSQTAVFDGFYLSVINGGARAFAFAHPRTGETLALRIIGPPEYSARNSEYFLVNLEAEALP